MEKNSPYDKHLLVCNGERCNRDNTAHKIRTYFKQMVQLEGLNIRTSYSSCVGLCDTALNVVIYPEQVVYCRVKSEDVPEIVERHLVDGEVVNELLRPADQPGTGSND